MTLLSGALLWGLELDTRYRVLAATVEPAGSSLSSSHDPRVQVAFHPCSVFETRLVKTAEGGGAVLERFSIDQLLDVAVALNGPAVSGVEVDGPPPQWRDVSLEGRSQAPDGHSHRVRFSVSDGGRILDVHATFDDVDARSADGTVLPLDGGQGL